MIKQYLHDCGQVYCPHSQIYGMCWDFLFPLPCSVWKLRIPLGIPALLFLIHPPEASNPAQFPSWDIIYVPVILLPVSRFHFCSILGLLLSLAVSPVNLAQNFGNFWCSPAGTQCPSAVAWGGKECSHLLHASLPFIS